MAHKRCVALDSPFSDLLSGTRIDERELNINVPAIHMYSSHVQAPRGSGSQHTEAARKCASTCSKDRSCPCGWGSLWVLLCNQWCRTAVLTGTWDGGEFRSISSCEASCILAATCSIAAGYDVDYPKSGCPRQAEARALVASSCNLART